MYLAGAKQVTYRRTHLILPFPLPVSPEAALFSHLGKLRRRAIRSLGHRPTARKQGRAEMRIQASGASLQHLHPLGLGS